MNETPSMNHFTPVPALIGGILIGAASALLLLSHGRIAGISGLYGALFRKGSERNAPAFLFVAGLVSVGVILRVAFPQVLEDHVPKGVPLTLVSGLLVGLGTQLGNGCTSGHGVCGISRGSIRSVVATLVFMATAAVTVMAMHRVQGGNP